jgi:hypothetical protein
VKRSPPSATAVPILDETSRTTSGPGTAVLSHEMNVAGETGATTALSAGRFTAAGADSALFAVNGKRSAVSVPR